MDFVDWCDHVLNNIVKASASPAALSRGYLTDDLLAQTLFGEKMSKQFSGSAQRERLHTAVDELVRNHLVTKKQVGQMYRIDITGLGLSLSEDIHPLRREISLIKLSPEAEQLLELVNRLSQKTEPDLAWVEAVNRELLPELGWEDKEKRIRSIRELEHYGFVRSHPPLGSDLDLTATYRGIVWETRRLSDETTEAEIAHVLFTDIVGYSKPSIAIAMQRQLRKCLNKVVYGTETYRAALERERVISRTIGDGLVLAFFVDPAMAARCAVEVSRALRNQPGLHLRMGVHTGPVLRDRDFEGQLDVVGGGINLAQRVMDAGDAGHILLSQTVADNLQQLGGWSEYIHKLGERKVKHGVRVCFFNLYGDGLGNAKLPKSFKKWRSLFPVMLFVLGSLLILAAAYWIMVHNSSQDQLQMSNHSESRPEPSPSPRRTLTIEPSDDRSRRR